MRWRRWCAALLLLGAPADVATGESAPFPAIFHNPAIFERALAAESVTNLPAEAGITGITVPHHLLAADLIARGFRVAAGGKYDRLVVFHPDHFQKSTRPFATTLRDFETIYGRVAIDREAIEAMLGRSSSLETSDLFQAEHGIHALLPFVARHFPSSKLIPIAVALDSRQGDWDAMVELLKPWLSERTLVVQSTDFSHYLRRREARQRDQESLNAIASGNLAKIAALRQPAHLDSRGSQYLQSKLQREVYRAEPEIIENKNSCDYLGDAEQRTTSYMVQIYRRRQPVRTPVAPFAGQAIWFFGGDTNFGRFTTLHLRDPAVSQRLQDRILAVTGGYPLVVNLEGVMMDDPPSGALPPLRIAMETAPTLAWLKRINVRGVSLANNHAMDFGETRRAAMREALRGAQIAALLPSEPHDFGPFRLVALSDVANFGEQRSELVSEDDLAAIETHRLPQPVVAFMHWGAEYKPEPGKRELVLFEHLRQRGCRLIVGAHPHVASAGILTSPDASAAGVYSLGNFVFDQLSPKTSGALLEARFFAQGTYALRLHALGNLLGEVTRASRSGAREPHASVFQSAESAKCTGGK